MVAIALMAGCYSPRVLPGSPCDLASPCPSSLVCTGGTCQLPGAPIDAESEADAAIDGCAPAGPEVCGDGIDQDCTGGDAACPANDHADAAIDVTAGGTWQVDLDLLTDDLASLAAPGCNADGGRDAFYRVTLAAPQVYGFDTFGSNFDTSVRVFPGVACPAVTNTMVPGACSDDTCGGGQSAVGALLPAGTSCVVLDQNQNQANGDAQLHVYPGRRTGDALPRGTAQLHGDTCGGADLSSSPTCDEANAKDLAYWFLACPGATTIVDANTCGAMAETNFDTVLAIHAAAGTELVCDDDDDGERGGRVCTATEGGSVLQRTVRGPGLFWLVIDGFQDECGKYRVDTRLR